MPVVTFTRAGQLTPFIDAIRHIGAPVDVCLARVGLSTALLDKPERLIPEAPLWLLAQQVSEMQELPSFGFVVGEMNSLAQLGTFGQTVCSSRTLDEAIGGFIGQLREHQNSPPFWMTRTRDDIWIHRLGSPDMPCGHWQIEQYVVSVLVQLVRLAAGPEWTPPQVHVQAIETVGVERAGVLRGSRLFVGQSSTAIAVPRQLLPMPLREPAEKLASSSGALSSRLSENLSHYLSRVLELASPPELDAIAKQLCISSRTLQRRLGREETSYSSLLDNARHRRAIEVLTTSSVTIGRLASDLGYSDPAHFTRAFKRWEQCTPREFASRPLGGAIK
jgi:AraC-like DNA-binding protein